MQTALFISGLQNSVIYTKAFFAHDVHSYTKTDDH